MLASVGIRVPHLHLCSSLISRQEPREASDLPFIAIPWQSPNKKLSSLHFPLLTSMYLIMVMDYEENVRDLQQSESLVGVVVVGRPGCLRPATYSAIARLDGESGSKDANGDSPTHRTHTHTMNAIVEELKFNNVIVRHRKRSKGQKVKRFFTHFTLYFRSSKGARMQ